MSESAINQLCHQLRKLDDQRRDYQAKASEIVDQLDPITVALKEIDDSTKFTRQRLHEAMEAEGKKSFKAHDFSVSISTRSDVKVVDQAQAVAAITELGRLEEITTVAISQTAIKRIAKEQPELIPGTEFVESTTLTVRDGLK